MLATELELQVASSSVLTRDWALTSSGPSSQPVKRSIVRGGDFSHGSEANSQQV